MKITPFWLFLIIALSLATVATISLILNIGDEKSQSISDKRYTLPALPYSYNALEPYIDTETMNIHYTKHHQAYVDNLNAAFKEYPHFYGLTLEHILTHLNEIPEKIRAEVKNNAGGHYNHSLFWQILKSGPSNGPKGVIKDEINKAFGNFEKFKELFNLAAKKVFGSGWAWLCYDPTTKKLIITTTKDQDNPISIGLISILGLDVWEHAYYLKYQNRRIDYITSWWCVVNWDAVQINYDNAIKI